MHISTEALFLIQALILIGAPFLLWRLNFVHKFAPLVVIQIFLGIVLGPTILGRYSPGLYNDLFSLQSLNVLNGISWFGLCFFGFLTGLHFDMKIVTQKSYAFFATSFSTLLVPMLLGGLFAMAFFREPYIGAGTNKWTYVTGVAIAIAVTALPVLSAILIELKLINTAIGKRVLGYAAINDVSLWIIIGCLVIFASPNNEANKLNAVIQTISLAVLFLLFMQTAVRRTAKYLAARKLLTDTPSSSQFATVVVGILASALATELIGIHYVFGAFIFGAVLPGEVRTGLYKAFEEFTMVALMPFYFILTGLKTYFSFDDSAAWTFFVLATAVSMSGKIFGTALPEYFINKASANTAIKSGILMQTKGLMEIVVLNILLAEGIISTTVFSALVLMAITTTFLTKPSIIFSSYMLSIFRGKSPDSPLYLNKVRKLLHERY